MLLVMRVMQKSTRHHEGACLACACRAAAPSCRTPWQNGKCQKRDFFHYFFSTGALSCFGGRGMTTDRSDAARASACFVSSSTLLFCSAAWQTRHIIMIINKPTTDLVRILHLLHEGLAVGRRLDRLQTKRRQRGQAQPCLSRSYNVGNVEVALDCPGSAQTKLAQ